MLGAVSPYRALYLVALGAAALFVAALAAGVATGGRAGLSPGRRALLHWMPIAGAVLLAQIMGWPDVALGLIFGTSVAVLSTAVGSLCTVAPVGPAPAKWKRLWPFTLAAALIVFVSGFNGLLTWKHGLALAIEGLVILSLWRDPAYQHDWAGVLPESPAWPMPESVSWLVAGLSALVAAGGTWLAVSGALGVAYLRVHPSPGALAASLLSLALTTPMIQSGRRLALAGASWVPMTGHIGVVLLNLCVLLPAISMVPYATALAGAVRYKPLLTIDWSAVSPQATVFPLAAWRIDTVVLIVLSVLQLPVAMGKWNLGREEGYLLIAAYGAYLLAVTVSGL